MSSRALWTNRLVPSKLLLLLVVLGTAPTAWAQGKQDGCLTDPDCKQRYDQAISLYDAGKYADALPEFQAAYNRRQMPWLMLNIGRTLQRLGRPQEAISYYERFKKAELNIDAATLERVNKYIEQTKALLDSPADPATTPAKDPVVKDPAAKDPAAKDPASPPIGPVAGAVTPGLNLNPPNEPPKDVLPQATPVYKKWWFWTIIGVVVAGGVAGGVAGALLSKKSPTPDTILPTDPQYMPTF